MTTDPPPSPDGDGIVEGAGAGAPASTESVESAEANPPTATQPVEPPAAPHREGFTRASAAWVATAVVLVLLILLIIFFAQNTTDVEIHFLGWTGSISLGLALLIAAVGGGALVAIAGVTRVTQLRLHARRARREMSGP